MERCELLSKLYLYLLFATIIGSGQSHPLLWIAFKIVSLFTIRNGWSKRKLTSTVVNCFQNCIFIYYSQQKLTDKNINYGCELLSKLYLYLLFATCLLNYCWCEQLWIAFKIVSLFTIRNVTFSFSKGYAVVNCFQNCIFIYYSQRQLL